MDEKRREDIEELAGLLTEFRLAKITKERRTIDVPAKAINVSEIPENDDYFCRLIENGDAIHNRLVDKLHADMQSVYDDTNGAQILRAGVITIWRFEDRTVVVDGKHRLWIAGQFYPDVPLQVRETVLTSWPENFFDELLLPHTILSNLVSRTLSDELRILVLAKAVEYEIRSYLREGQVPNLETLVRENQNYWGEAINAEYVSALMRTIEWSYSVVLPRSVGGRGKPTTPVGPSDLTPGVRDFLDGRLPQTNRFPAKTSLRALLDWSRSPTGERIGSPAPRESFHFRTGYSHTEEQLRNHILELQKHGFPIATSYDLTNFADWAYEYALEQVKAGKVAWSSIARYIGEQYTSNYEVQRDNPCPECKSSFWLRYTPEWEGPDRLLCTSRRHFTKFPRGYRFAPKNAGENCQ